MANPEKSNVRFYAIREKGTNGYLQQGTNRSGGLFNEPVLHTQISLTQGFFETEGRLIEATDELVEFELVPTGRVFSYEKQTDAVRG
jgi:hypothetical protein